MPLNRYGTKKFGTFKYGRSTEMRAIGVVVDEALTIEQDKNYNLRVRRRYDSLLLPLLLKTILAVLTLHHT